MLENKKTHPKGCAAYLNDDGFCQLIVDIIPTVLDGHGAAALSAGYHRDGLAAVATQGEQEGIELLVVGFDAADDIFLSFHGASQIHVSHLIPLPKFLAISIC